MSSSISNSIIKQIGLRANKYSHKQINSPVGGGWLVYGGRDGGDSSSRRHQTANPFIHFAIVSGEINVMKC